MAEIGLRSIGNTVGESKVQGQDTGRHWARTSTLMWIMLFLWVVFSFIIHFFVKDLNAFKILGFPLGFYMASQGSLVVFVAMLFWFQMSQDKIDREEGVAED